MGAQMAFWYGPMGVLWLVEEMWENVLWMTQQLANVQKPTVESDLTPRGAPATVRIVDASYDGKEYTLTIEAAWRGYPLSPLGPYLDEPPQAALYPFSKQFKHLKVEITFKWEGGSRTVTLYVKKYGSERTTVKLPQPYGYAKVTVMDIWEVKREDLKTYGAVALAGLAATSAGTAAAAAMGATASTGGLATIAAKIKAVLAPLAGKAGVTGALDSVATALAEYLLRIEGISPSQMDYWLALTNLITAIKKAIAAGAIAGAAAAAAAAIAKAGEEEIAETEKAATAIAGAGGGVLARELIKIT